MTPEDPKVAGARAEVAQIVALKQRRAVGVPPTRRSTSSSGATRKAESVGDLVAATGEGHDVPVPVSSEHGGNAPVPSMTTGATTLHQPDRGKPSTRLRRTPHLMIRTSFRLPVTVAEEFRRMLIEERNNGRRLMMQSVVNDAVLALPADVDDLIDVIDTYGDELNIGIMAGETGYRIETSVSLSLTEEASARLGELVERLRDRDFVVGRKTLVGVAVVRVMRSGLPT
jgi:hypothetical protein